MANNLILDATLPMPPSVNDYWGYRAVGKGIKSFVQMYLKPKAKAYRKQVTQLISINNPSDKRLKAVITMHYSDKRKNDIDNRIKALFDALTHAGVYQDDSQIDVMVVTRGECVKGGAVDVEIWEL